ncbi:uncharacterized protein LOC142982436 [Anticarsia gemmatalis]|uniref:uncharacterized protein LOC142982436 n=1 Tax=Anticarsia gemmatalis TaxID=129554 RepID=UPI003F7580D7
MAQNGYGAAPVAGHMGRIPNYGKTQVNPMGSVEPPACIQNAMMTKDKKPFTYTPGGLDLSQIRTPSMARRLARQRSWEEREQPQYAQQPSNGNYHPQGGPGGPIPPPPPPPKMPVPPPPPPPIVIQVPDSKSPKPIVPGERPEIVIPENPIGMLRKTNSPYHWEAEKAELQKLGNTPRYVDKVPSPLTVKMPPSSFTQQQPQSYTPQNNYQRSPYAHQNQPESPIHRPEAKYAHQNSSSPHGSPPTRELLQRQDSQFNKSPQPFSGQTPISSGSPYSPSPNNNWRQPEKRDSPANSPLVQSPHSPQINRGAFSPSTQQYSPNTQQYSPNNQQYSPNKPQYSPNYQNQSPPTNSGPVFHTLPRAGQRNVEPQNNNVMYNNTKPSPPTENNTAPWRTQTLNRHPREPENQQTIYNNVNSNQEQAYTPPWKVNQANNNAAQNENAYVPPWKQESKPQPQYTPPWVQAANNNRAEENTAPWRHQEPPASPPKSNQEQPRYQSTMSIPVTPRRQNPQPEYNNAPQKEVVYVNEEPVYFCPESPKSVPPWVKTQKEKTKTPPPAWVQRPLEARKSLSRELATPPRDNQEPEWVRKSNEMQRGVREVVSPPKYQQPVQPSWSTKPSENRKSLPRDNGPGSPGTRVIPIQMEVSTTETRDNRHGGQGNHPQLRITIGMNPNPQDNRAPFSPPTQRIMRVLSPQLVRLEDNNPQPDLPTLNRSFQEPKTRIIPIQIEGANGGSNKSFGGRY